MSILCTFQCDNRSLQCTRTHYCGCTFVMLYIVHSIINNHINTIEKVKLHKRFVFKQLYFPNPLNFKHETTMKLFRQNIIDIL